MVLDESIRRDVITLGGLILPLARVGNVVGEWQILKGEFGLEPSDELKYSIHPDHPSRLRLDDNGWSVAKRLPRMLEVIASTGVVLISNTLTDERIIQTGRATDFYLDAFNWCLRRFANHVQWNLGRPQGPHMVVVDMPPPAGDIDPVVRPRIYDLIKNMGTAPYEHYQERYHCCEQFPNGSRGVPLKLLGFAPMLGATHARHSDLHQMADVVAGCVAEYCSFNLAHADDWGQLAVPTFREANLGIIAGSFRGGTPITSYGLGLFPGDGLAAHPLIDRFLELRRTQTDL